jgi:hypothetical protein
VAGAILAAIETVDFDTAVPDPLPLDGFGLALGDLVDAFVASRWGYAVRLGGDLSWMLSEAALHFGSPTDVWQLQIATAATVGRLEREHAGA